MTKLILARHGQTDWNIQGRWQGYADAPLNAVGQEQARKLAAELAPAQITAIYSSDLQRALATAQAVAELHGMTVHTDRRLRELNMGEWEGKLATEIPGLYPEAWAWREHDPVDSHPPEGESVRKLAARVIAAITEICRNHPGPEQVLVVSHGLALATFLCSLDSRPLAEAFMHIPHNATPVYVEWTPEEQQHPH